MAALGAGLRRAAGEAGLVDLEVYEASDFTLDAGVDAGNRLVDRGDPPSAVVASSDVLAIGLLRAARDRGVRVPEDLAVVGYGALDVSDLIEPPLATVALPALEMGRLAMERLTGLVHRRPTPADTTVLPTRFLPRRSCGCG